MIEMKPSDDGELLEMEDGIDWRIRMVQFKEWIRSIIFVFALFVMFVVLTYWGIEKHEDLGTGLLIVGALFTAGLIAVALAGITNWLFTGIKPVEQETLTDEEHKKMVEEAERETKDATS